MSGPWVKICGITTPEAVSVAVAARADAIGFVFADSPRRVTPEQAYRLAAPARNRLACVAVVRRTTQQQIDEILQILRPDILQADVDELPKLRLPRTLEVLPVVSTRMGPPDLLPERVMLERPPTDDEAGWDEAQIRNMYRRTRLILAGGLNAANVGEILRSVQPFGVDVSRGVEVQPGIKGPDLIRQFVRAARSLNGAILL